MTGYMMRKYLADPTAAVASFAPIVQVHNPYSNVQYLFKLPNGTVSNLVMALPNGTAVTATPTHPRRRPATCPDCQRAA